MEIPKLNLSEAIRRAQDLYGGYSALEERIETANAALGRVTVDRRKLKAIADGKEFTISTTELVALDNYFALTGEGLSDQPLFVRQSVLEGFAENPRIIFVVGAFARDDEVRNDVNLWDIKAFQEVLSGVHRFREGIHNTLQEFPFLNEQGFHNQDPEAWEHILRKGHPGICGIGSPRASVATEFLLAEMFQVKPFVKPAKRLPFQFIWPVDDYRQQHHFASAFETALHGEIEGTVNPRRAREARTRALLVNNKLFEVVPKRAGSWDDYGIVAAQRRSDGRVWLVVAGVTGPATYACAIACRTRMNIAIPQPSDGRPSPVIWAPVRATVSERSRGIGDIRYVESVDLLQKPQHWPKPQ